MERLKQLIIKNERAKERQNKLRVETICPYCSKSVFFYHLEKHFKSKICLKMKELYLLQPDKFEFQIMKQIQDQKYYLLE
jgi:hypothetical protein